MKSPDSSQHTPDEPWDDLFRQRLAEYTDQPPTDALEYILAGVNPARPRPYERWAPVSVVLLLMLGAGGWLFVRQYNIVSPVADRAHQPTTGAKPNTSLVTGSRVRQMGAPTEADSPQASARPDEEELAVATPKLTETIRLSIPTGSVVRREGIHPSVGVETPSPANTASLPRLMDKSANGKINGENRRIRHELKGIDRGTGREPLNSAGFSNAGLDRVATVAPVGPPVYWPATSLYQATATEVTTTTARQGLPWLSPVGLLASRPARAFVPTTVLPTVAVSDPVTTPVSSRPRPRSSLFVSLTPLYTYQRISPNQTDADLVSDIRVAHPLAADRLGGRLQIGTDWHLANRLRLRTSVVYQQVRQVLHYAVRSAQPDSVQAVVVDEQSVRVTPFFTRRNFAETDVWHYAGLSTDLVWQLNRNNNGRWQHYLTAGITAGRYVSRGGAVNGFIQAAYGVEHPLSTGLHLRLEPTLQLGWQDLTDRANRFQNRPYSYGLALGLRFR